MIFKLLKSSFSKLQKALSKTHLGTRLVSLFGKPLDQDTFEHLEMLLYEADLGSECVDALLSSAKDIAKRRSQPSVDDFIDAMKAVAIATFDASNKAVLPGITTSPHVILMTGVNGSGKTTSTAKLAHHYIKLGKSVLIAAADTFRAAAVEQLEIWAKRLHIDCIKGQSGSDPASIVYDAICSAKARHIDIVIADTAGRLESREDLMGQLKKIHQVCSKAMPGAPHETYLVLDATIGQSGIDQAAKFHQAAPLTGIILTKLDGSAKGGIILSIYKLLKIPVRFIGLGEAKEDFEPFNANAYVEALFHK